MNNAGLLKILRGGNAGIARNLADAAADAETIAKQMIDTGRLVLADIQQSRDAQAIEAEQRGEPVTAGQP